MNLFPSNFEQNILPYHGSLHYSPHFIPSNQASVLFETLIAQTPWENDKVILFGKTYITKRMVAFYGDKGLNYQYAQVNKKALPWPPSLMQIKSKVEAFTACSFNSCLLNLYHNGTEGMSWHSDNEAELGTNPSIASISLGAERKFSWKHKASKESFSQILASGSLLLMKDEMQKHWLHSLPKSKKITSPRINISFRNIL